MLFQVDLTGTSADAVFRQFWIGAEAGDARIDVRGDGGAARGPRRQAGELGVEHDGRVVGAPAVEVEGPHHVARVAAAEALDADRAAGRGVGR